MLAKESDLLLKSSRHRHVVAVEARQKLAARDLQRRIARRDNALVFLVENANARILRRVFLKSCQRVVGRSVVDDNEFEILEGLGKDASNGFVEVSNGVVYPG